MTYAYLSRQDRENVQRIADYSRKLATLLDSLLLEDMAGVKNEDVLHDARELAPQLAYRVSELRALAYTKTREDAE